MPCDYGYCFHLLFLLSGRLSVCLITAYPCGNTNNTTGVRIHPALFFGNQRIKISDTNDLGVIVFRTDSGDPFVFVLGYQIHIKQHSQKVYAVGNDALLMSVLLSIEQPLQVFNAEAYYNGTVNGGKGLAVEPADVFAEPRFVYRPDLFEQNGGFGFKPFRMIFTWVGRVAFVFLLVIAATMVVGLCLLPMSFCKIKDGRVPPCSLPQPVPKSTA